MQLSKGKPPPPPLLCYLITLVTGPVFCVAGYRYKKPGTPQPHCCVIKCYSLGSLYREVFSVNLQTEN